MDEEQQKLEKIRKQLTNALWARHDEEFLRRVNGLPAVEYKYDPATGKSWARTGGGEWVET